MKTRIGEEAHINTLKTQNYFGKGFLYTWLPISRGHGVILGRSPEKKSQSFRSRRILELSPVGEAHRCVVPWLSDLLSMASEGTILLALSQCCQGPRTAVPASFAALLDQGIISTFGEEPLDGKVSESR